MKISACVITKDEEKNISKCLGSIKPIASEIVVVDTGSTDNTVQEAEKYGAKIYHFKWQNDFSAARNFAISKAKGDWIIFLDADESFTKESVEILPDILYEAVKGKYDVIFSLIVNYDKNTGASINTFPVVRIFRNDKYIRYAGTIHEIVVNEKRPLKRMDATKYLKIIHTGYSQDIIQEKEKGKRNLELLLLEEKKNPQNSNICFYLSEAYLLKGDNDKALEYAFKVLKYRNGNLIGIYQKNYINLITTMVNRGYPKEDSKYIIKRAVSEFPNIPDFRFFLGDYFRQEGRVSDAIWEYENGMKNIDQGLNFQSQAPFSINKVLMILGRLYYRLSQFEKTTKHLIEILKTDIYEFLPLKNLIMLFSQYEKNENIYFFMKKLYDYEKPKDLLFLLKAALKANNGELAEYYYKLLYDYHNINLSSDLAHINLLNRNYAESALEYMKLYLVNNKADYAHKCIVSAVIIGDEPTLHEIYEKVKPSLQRMIDREREKEVAIIPDDKNDILNYFMEYVKAGESERLVSKIDWIIKAGLLYEVAEMLYFNEKYSVAAELFPKYMTDQLYIPVQKRADVYAKMGECLFYCNRYVEALQFYSQSRQYNPLDYRAYERPMIICELIGDREQLKEIAQKGLCIFPDSYFMASKLTK
jgi:glycosyltransferase involved in cell wall biosynthesis